MSKNTFVQQAKVISFMLHRKFEGANFKVTVHKECSNDKGFREIIRRWIRVECDFEECNFGKVDGFHKKDVIYYLQRFQDSEEDRRGDVFTRSFWVSPKGFATLGLIRRNRKDGTSSIVERHDPPNPNQTKLVRFEIQEYEVVEAIDLKSSSTFTEEGWDEFSE